MQAKTAIFLMICVVLGHAFSTNDIARLEKTTFGKTLFDTIQIQMESKEPIANLLNLLNGMADNLAKEQQAADDAHKDYQEHCARDLATYKSHIADANAKIKRSTDLLVVLRANLSRSEDELHDTQGKLKDTEDDLAQTHQQRKDEDAEYQLKKKEHQQAELIIGKAKEVFATLKAKGPSVFLQERLTVFAQVASELKSSLKSMNDKGYKAIVRILISISERAPIQADQEVVQRILDLCDQIIDNIQASAVLEKKAEDERIRQYNNRVHELTNQINNLHGHISSLNTIIAGLKERIGVNEKIIRDQTQRRNENQQNWDDRNTECNNELNAYNAATKKRNGERETVADVIQIIKSRIATLREYIKKRLGGI